jgi:hypothetical protein
VAEEKLTLEDGQEALRTHVVDCAVTIRELYGPAVTPEALQKILADDRCVRFPTRIVFDDEPLGEGMFAVARPVGDESSWEVIVHPAFEDRPIYLPALVLYHLVTVNYGEFASYEDAEVFGATVLGMDQEAYYQLLCRLADELEK